MNGGAYGAFAQPDNLEGPFSFSTYRDPNPLRSLEAFSSILRDASRREASQDCEAVPAPDEEALTKTVIGAFARETRPRTPSEKGFADFLRFLYGIEDRHRLKRLQDLVAVGQDQIDTVLKRLAGETRSTNETGGDTWPVIIAGTAEAEKAAAKLGVQAFELPV